MNFSRPDDKSCTIIFFLSNTILKAQVKNVTEIDFDSILSYIKTTKEMINFSFERLISINI